MENQINDERLQKLLDALHAELDKLQPFTKENVKAKVKEVFGKKW